MTDEAKPFRMWQALLSGEIVAVLIALATTIVPSKTGSDSGFAGRLFHDPTFAEEFLFNLTAVNIILLVLAIGIAICWNATEAKRSPGSD
jgi:hypothetical protein